MRTRLFLVDVGCSVLPFYHSHFQDGVIQLSEWQAYFQHRAGHLAGEFVGTKRACLPFLLTTSPVAALAVPGPAPEQPCSPPQGVAVQIDSAQDSPPCTEEHGPGCPLHDTPQSPPHPHTMPTEDHTLESADLSAAQLPHSTATEPPRATAERPKELPLENVAQEGAPEAAADAGESAARMETEADAPEALPLESLPLESDVLPLESDVLPLGDDALPLGDEAQRGTSTEQGYDVSVSMERDIASVHTTPEQHCALHTPPPDDAAFSGSDSFSGMSVPELIMSKKREQGATLSSLHTPPGSSFIGS